MLLALPPILESIFRTNGAVVLVIVVAALLVVIGVQVALFVRQSRLMRLYTRLTRGTSGGNLEDVLTDHMNKVEAMSDRVSNLERRSADLSAIQETCLRKVGVVRYDAFEDVGGQQSFSLVLLDGTNSGLAMSSLFSRTDVRIYTKQIECGRPSQPLSTEEQQALAAAALGKAA